MIASRVREFINEELLRGEDVVVQRDNDPLLEGILDSVGLLQLVAFVEEEFEIQIDDAEIVAENFSSAETIEKLVQRQVQSKAGRE